MPTYTGSKAAIALGTIVSIGPLASATGSPTYVPIAEIIDVEFSGAKTQVLDVTNMSSSGKEKLGTIPDWGQVKITMNRVTNDAGQTALKAAFASAGKYLFTIQEPVDDALGQTTTGNLYTVQAIVSDGPSFTLSPEKNPVLSYTLDLSNAPQFTAGT